MIMPNKQQLHLIAAKSEYPLMTEHMREKWAFQRPLATSDPKITNLRVGAGRSFD